jgi:type IV pilus assembly protein PilA
MKNLMNKIRKANKGFTLVELIIVIAVIAVLSAVVAPQYIKYVERSRQGVDASTLQEIKHVVEIEAGTTDSLAQSTITIAIDDTSLAVTVSGDDAGSFKDGSAAITNVNATLGTPKFKSKIAAGYDYKLTVSAAGAVAWEAGSESAPKSAENIAKLQSGILTAPRVG